MSRRRFDVIQPWLSLLVRVAIATILVFAAIPKLQDLEGSVRAVRAYRLLPEAITPVTGYLLPFVEVIVAVLVLAGLFTRIMATVWLLMMAAFTFGVAWAWAKGYQIDCGCFSSGGDLEEGEEASYGSSLALRGVFIALGAYLWVFPRSKFSVDSAIEIPPAPAPDHSER